MRCTVSATIASAALAFSTSGLTCQADAASATTPQTSASSNYLPSRGQDARVAQIAFRLATAGVTRCLRSVPVLGLVLQHLSQFELADRPGMVAAYHLDRGPGVVAVVADSPAARAAIRAGDVLLATDGISLPREEGTAQPFDQDRARSRADRMLDRLGARGRAPMQITLLRDDMTVTTQTTPMQGCPSRVHLARSDQRNAYADGLHVFLTTRLVAMTTGDDELAFVIAHEMAHNILGHAAVMRGGSVKRGLGRTLGRSGKVVRGTERAADALGGELMLDAGYDPIAGAGVLRRLGGGNLGITLFAAHDSTGDRIAAMRSLAAARDRR